MKEESFKRLTELVDAFVDKKRLKYIATDWSQTSLDCQESRSLIEQYIGKRMTSIIVHNVCEVETHFDRMSKSVFLFVVHGSENAIFYESDRGLPLTTGSIFTFNDFNEHGIYQINDETRETYDELWLITAESSCN